MAWLPISAAAAAANSCTFITALHRGRAREQIMPRHPQQNGTVQLWKLYPFSGDFMLRAAIIGSETYMDRLDAVTVFVAVAEQESFAAAARKLSRTPAAVTRAVAELE